jgi:hypothetical protein
MAQIAAIRTAMTRIGFEVEAANLLTDDQGMNALEELALLTDEEVTNLCRVIRRPGMRPQDSRLTFRILDGLFLSVLRTTSS